MIHGKLAYKLLNIFGHKIAIHVVGHKYIIGVKSENTYIMIVRVELNRNSELFCIEVEFFFLL